MRGGRVGGAEKPAGFTFTRDEIEAALCIWEWINDLSMGKAGMRVPALTAYHEEVGTVELRFTCIGFARWCGAVYERLPDDIQDCHPFDWEIVPAICSTIDWSCRPPAHPNAATAAKAVTKLLRTGHSAVT